MMDPSHQIGWWGQSEADDAAFAVAYLHRLRFTRDAFDVTNRLLSDILITDGDSPARILVFVDEGVANAWPDLDNRISRYASAYADRMILAGPPCTVAGGEVSKNDWSVFEAVARAIKDTSICRHSYVLVIGGGAVLDTVGFAAATAHRGVRLVRLPSTTLSQADSGVGVKNGINAFGKKNFLGTFAPPWAVINDEVFLSTLSDRDWRCGLSEAVKVALVKSERFFEQIVAGVPRLRKRDHAALRPVIRRSAEIHFRHVVDGGDPFELREGRPLDFGHWSAHKLEEMTNFCLKHGEAVAIGIALDVVYSAMSGLLEWSDVKRILDCLTGLGLAVSHQALADSDVLLEGLESFREHLGGRLTITLLNGVGRPVDVHEIDRPVMIQAADWLRAAVARGAVWRTLQQHV